MKISMYDAAVKTGIRMMTNLASVLEKAAQHAEARKIDPEVFVGARLAPDMFPLSRQVQIASDSVKMGAARLAGVAAPSLEDDEKTLARAGGARAQDGAIPRDAQAGTVRRRGSARGPLEIAKRGARNAGTPLPAAPDAAERAFPLHDDLRHPAPQRRRARQDGLPRPRPAGPERQIPALHPAESSALEIGKCRRDLALAVHHEGAVSDDRLGDRLAGQHQRRQLSLGRHR